MAVNDKDYTRVPIQRDADQQPKNDDTTSVPIQRNKEQAVSPEYTRVPIQNPATTQSGEWQDESTHPEAYGFTPQNIVKNVGDVVQGLLGMPGQIYHAFTDEPTEEEKQRYAQFEKEQKKGLGEIGTASGSQPGSQTSGAKRVGLGFERLIRPGYEHEQQRAEEESKAASEAGAKGDVLSVAGHGALELGHKLGSYLPIVGPMAGELADQAASGDIGGALTKAATYYLTGKAAEALPKVATEVSKGIPITMPGGGEARIKIPLASKGMGRAIDIADKVQRYTTKAREVGTGGLSQLAEATARGPLYDAWVKRYKAVAEQHYGYTPSETEIRRDYLNRIRLPIRTVVEPLPTPLQEGEAPYPSPRHTSFIPTEEEALLKERRQQPRLVEGGNIEYYGPTSESATTVDQPLELTPEQQAAQAARSKRPLGKIEVPEERSEGPETSPVAAPVVTEPQATPSETLIPETKATAAEMRRVVEEPAVALEPLLREGLKRGSEEGKPIVLGARETPAVEPVGIPRATEEAAPKAKATEAETPKAAPKEAAEYSPEDEPKVQTVLSDHTDQELMRLGRKYGLDDSEYDFSKRDANRHRVEREQFVKDLLEKLPEKDKANIARLLDEFTSKDTTTWTEAERNAMSRSQRARAIMQEHTGGPKSVRGGAPEESEAAKTAKEYLRTLPESMGGGEVLSSSARSEEPGVVNIGGRTSKVRAVPEESLTPAAHAAASKYVREAFPTIKSAVVPEEGIIKPTSEELSTEAQRFLAQHPREIGRIIPEKTSELTEPEKQAEAASYLQDVTGAEGSLISSPRESVKASFVRGGQMNPALPRIVTDPAQLLSDIKARQGIPLGGKPSPKAVPETLGKTPTAEEVAALKSRILQSPAGVPKAKIESFDSPDIEAFEGARTHSVMSGDKVLGSLVTSPTNTPGEVAVRSAHVKAPYRNQGHGFNLYEHAISDSADQGYKYFRSDPISVSEDAQKLWTDLAKTYPVETFIDPVTGKVGYRINLQEWKKAPRGTELLSKPLISSEKPSKVTIPRIGEPTESFISRLLQKLDVPEQVSEDLLAEYEGQEAALRAKLLRLSPEELKELKNKK